MSGESSRRPVDPPSSPEPLVLSNAGHVWVGGATGHRLMSGVDVVCSNGKVAAIGPSAERPSGARVIDASNWLVVPGLVNAHHHLSQQLTRTLAPSGDTVAWLAACYPLWARINAEMASHGARIGMGELLLAGVTTTADLSYYYPRGHADIFDAQVNAAREMGIRMLAVRGGMRDVGDEVRKRIGSHVDSTIESSETLLSELERVTTVFHNFQPDAMVKVGVGLTEPLWDEPDLMRELSGFATQNGLPLHTHLHPRPSEREVAYGGGVVGALQELGWWGDNLWIAHGTNLSHNELLAMRQAGVALATCPSSNARLAASIAPAWQLDRLGGTVAIGVDGAASNDSGSMVGEARLAWQMQRIASRGNDDIADLLPELVLGWATTGGAAAIGWPTVGELSTGGLADVSCFDLSSIDYVGTTNPLDALLLCGLSHRASLVIVNGHIVVENGHLTRIDENTLARDGRKAARALLAGQ